MPDTGDRRHATKLLLAILLGTALIAGISRFLVSHYDPRKEETYIPHAVATTPETDLLRDYVRINTSNPPGNETAGARFLQSVLSKNGIASEVIESGPGRGNLYARIAGRSHDEGLLLLHHIDVVPAPADIWKFPPFSGKVVIDTMYGRGTLDMKGIGICELAAFMKIARSGRVPDHDIVLLGVADEESGGTMGTLWLLRNRPDVFRGMHYVINEGGITEVKSEQLQYFGVELGAKAAVFLKLHASSRQSLVAARIALEPFFAPQEPDRVLPEVRRFFHDVAPFREQLESKLTDVDRTIREGKFWLLPYGYRELMQNVVFAGAIVPDGARFSMPAFLLNLPDEEPANRIAWLRSMVEPLGAEVETVSSTGPIPLSSEDTPVYRIIRSSVAEEYPGVAMGSEILTKSSTDCRYLRPLGMQCYGMWPFRVDFYQSTTIHLNNERVRLDWFIQGVRLMERITSSYAFPSQTADAKGH